MEKPKKHSLDFEKPLHALELQLEEIQKSSTSSDLDFSSEIKAIEAKIEKTKREVIPTFLHGKKYNCPGILTARIPLTLSAGHLMILRNFTETGCTRMIRQSLVGLPPLMDAA